MGLLYPRFTYDSVMHFPGSEHMGVFKRLMVDNDWYRLVPRQDLIIGGFAARENYIPIAGENMRLLVYFPMHTDSVTIKFAELGTGMSLWWINPSTGDTAFSTDLIDPMGLGVRTIAPPDTSDWLLLTKGIVVTGTAKEAMPHESGPFQVQLPMPNPCNGRTWLCFTLPEPGELMMTWSDMLGRRVGTRTMIVSQGRGVEPIEGLGSGVYQVQLLYLPLSGGAERWEGKVVSLR
jgi:hypothetical protein